MPTAVFKSCYATEKFLYSFGGTLGCNMKLNKKNKQLQKIDVSSYYYTKVDIYWFQV